MVISPQFDDAYDFANNGLAAVYIDGKYGCSDQKGNLVIDAIYDRIICFDDYILTEKNGKLGVLDASGNMIVDFLYDSIGDNRVLFSY
jgi:hypothetical protein